MLLKNRVTGILRNRGSIPHVFIMNITQKEMMVNVLGRDCVLNVAEAFIVSDGINNETAVNSDDVILSPVNMSIASTQTKVVPVHGLNAISRFAEQTFNKEHAQITYTRTLQSSKSILKPNYPPPLIPLKFQTILKKVQQKNPQESLLRKAVENVTDKTVSLMLTAPSGVNSTTVTHHANRSLFYRKPVTTKDTALNGNEFNIIDLTETNSNSEQLQLNQSTEAHENTITVNSEVCNKIESPLLAAIVEPNTTNTSELIIEPATFQLSQPFKQQLQKQYQILSTNTVNQHFSHVKDNLLEFSEWVSNKCHSFFTHIVVSNMLFYFVLISREIRSFDGIFFSFVILFCLANH